MIRVLLDQGIPRSAASPLRGIGIEAVHVSELGMAASSDASILDYARKERLIVITLDADFHTQLAITGAANASVVRIRVQGLKGAAAADLIKFLLNKAGTELVAGAIVSVNTRLIRIKLLPISR